MTDAKIPECKVLFTTQKIGRLDNSRLLAQIDADESKKPRVVILRGPAGKYTTYDQLIEESKLNRNGVTDEALDEAARRVLPHQVCNLQFTSGTTGNPKAAMLTHQYVIFPTPTEEGKSNASPSNLVNNSRFIGDRMRLTSADTLCCPPPLFHCFGLVLGLLAVLTHGGRIVYPAEVFDPAATIAAITAERCTALHGVPAMFDSLLEKLPADFRCTTLRTGIVAGAPVPRPLMEKLVGVLGMTEFTSSYGLTEASPTCFNAFTDDAVARRLTTVGTLMPHARAKITDHDGNIVPVGTRGELCIAGYQLQAGYWNNSEKTAEVMVRDSAGVLWLKTGDEAVFDTDGYCAITGRFKDIIIRGGENIYPLEIEERLLAHPSVGRAIVVGLKDAHYGEVVAAFLELREGRVVPAADEVREWVRARLGRHKVPAHVFWLGKDGVPASVPLTGSGKVKKYEMAVLGERLLKDRTVSAKL